MEVLSAIFLAYWVSLKHPRLITALTVLDDIIKHAIANNPQWAAGSYGTGIDKSRVKKQSHCSTVLSIPVHRTAREK